MLIVSLSFSKKNFWIIYFYVLTFFHISAGLYSNGYNYYNGSNTPSTASPVYLMPYPYYSYDYYMPQPQSSAASPNANDEDVSNASNNNSNNDNSEETSNDKSASDNIKSTTEDDNKNANNTNNNTFNSDNVSIKLMDFLQFDFRGQRIKKCKKIK